MCKIIKETQSLIATIACLTNVCVTVIIIVATRASCYTKFLYI